jgi:hypothetical protein
MTALFMTLLYLLMVFTPLTPLARQTQPAPHPLSVECSGDCGICGCSPERSASHTCCCWQKKLALAKSRGEKSSRSCCAKKAAAHAGPVATETEVRRHDDHHDCDTPALKRAAPEPGIAVISQSPCGSGKQLLPWEDETVHHLPFVYSGGIPLLQTPPFNPSPPDRLLSHDSEPPEPPPKLSLPC